MASVNNGSVKHQQLSKSIDPFEGMAAFTW